METSVSKKLSLIWMLKKKTRNSVGSTFYRCIGVYIYVQILHRETVEFVKAQPKEWFII